MVLQSLLEIIMVMKSLLAEIVNGHLILPEDALAMLPTGIQLRVITDSGRGAMSFSQ